MKSVEWLSVIADFQLSCVTQKLQHADLAERVRDSMNVADFHSHKRSPYTNRKGAEMREPLELGTFDTEPYQEWLGVVGSLIVAAFVCTVLFAGGVLN
jgi:hypothetical protein